MKTLIKLAVGAAIAGALVSLLTKQASRQRKEAPVTLPAADRPIASAPVETLNDSSGTPLSASAVMEGRTTAGF